MESGEPIIDRRPHVSQSSIRTHYRYVWYLRNSSLRRRTKNRIQLQWDDEDLVNYYSSNSEHGSISRYYSSSYHQKSDVILICLGRSYSSITSVLACVGSYSRGQHVLRSTTHNVYEHGSNRGCPQWGRLNPVTPVRVPLPKIFVVFGTTIFA